MPAVSVVLCTYNEKENINILIPKVEDMLSRNRIDGEILVVDDSSPDGTAQAAMELAKNYKNVRVLVRPKKEGLGAAIRYGFDHGNGDVLFSMDSDLSLDVEDIPRFLGKIAEGYDFVVGSRYGERGSYEVGKPATVVKKIISTGGRFLIRTMMGLPVDDFSLNFKAIRSDVWKSLHTKENLYVFHLEMISQAHFKGYKVGSVQVAFKERMYGQSKTRLTQQAPVFLKKLVQFTWEYRIRPAFSGS
jgi:dolichol-phosphate mannosyltransferase